MTPFQENYNIIEDYWLESCLNFIPYLLRDKAWVKMTLQINFYFWMPLKRLMSFHYMFVRKRKSSKIFDKAKVALLKLKTLPTLELLTTFQVIKCLVNIQKTYQKIKLRNLYLTLDCPFVLTLQTNNKNTLVKNCLKNITQMGKEILSTHNLFIKYNYVHSSQNPADLITWDWRQLSWKRTSIIRAPDLAGVTRRDLALIWKNKKKGEKKKRKKKKNGSYHFEFSTQNEKLVVHASAPRRTSVCDKLTKKIH